MNSSIRRRIGESWEKRWRAVSPKIAARIGDLSHRQSWRAGVSLHVMPFWDETLLRTARDYKTYVTADSETP